MELICLGLNHETAPVEVRESFAVTAQEQGTSAKQIISLNNIAECVLLSTCNRMEVYCAVENSDHAEQILREHFGANDNQHLYRKDGDDAKRHLFRLVCGLDSMVIGETEIFGQVKQAYLQALENKATSGVLNRLFQKSFTVGKRIRTHTRIQMGQTSVGSVAVDLAEKIFGKLKGSDVMVIGAGEMSRQVAQSMLSRGANGVTVTNRTHERAAALADELGGDAVAFDSWEETLARVDVVVSSTGATEHVLRAEQIESVRRKRKFRPLFLIDIAVPRDIDPAVGLIEEVYLYDLDTLQTLAGEARASRARQVEICAEMIEQEI